MIDTLFITIINQSYVYFCIIFYRKPEVDYTELWLS